MPKRLVILPLFLALATLALFVSRSDAKLEAISQIAPKPPAGCRRPSQPREPASTHLRILN